MSAAVSPVEIREIWEDQSCSAGAGAIGQQAPNRQVHSSAMSYAHEASATLVPRLRGTSRKAHPSLERKAAARKLWSVQ